MPGDSGAWHTGLKESLREVHRAGGESFGPGNVTLQLFSPGIYGDAGKFACLPLPSLSSPAVDGLLNASAKVGFSFRARRDLFNWGA